MIPEQTSIHRVCNGQVRDDGDSKDGKLDWEGVRDIEGEGVFNSTVSECIVVSVVLFERVGYAFYIEQWLFCSKHLHLHHWV